mgnify:CR=1 FL=1
MGVNGRDVMIRWETITYINIYFIDSEKDFKEKRFRVYESIPKGVIWKKIFGLWGY